MARAPKKTSKKNRKFERQLERLNIEMLEDLNMLVNRFLVPRIEHLAQSFTSSQVNTDESPGETLMGLVDLVEAQFLSRWGKPRIDGELRHFFKEIDGELEQDTIREFQRQQITLFPSNTQEIIDNSVMTTRGKIQKNTKDLVDDIRGEISRGLTTGSRWEEIAKNIRGSVSSLSAIDMPKNPLKKAVNRAKFIARNEVSTALGAINEKRQRASGVELYRWQTADDERVRETHESMDGLLFSWDGSSGVTPQGENYGPAIDPIFSSSPTIPGEPWNCRCSAIPYFQELEEA
jgi:SPP1 gp7 family putative phage head morphogenesis protein